MPISRKRRKRTRRLTPDQRQRNLESIERVHSACVSCSRGETLDVTFLLTAETASRARETVSYTSAFVGDLSGSEQRA
jgi:hypothetical protein